MASIEQLDKNFAAKKEEGGLTWQAVQTLPCVLTGLHPGTFCRMNPSVLPKLPAPVQELTQHTAGGMVHFHGKAGRYGYRYELRSGEDMSHMPRTGSAGLDVYADWGEGFKFLSVSRPAYGVTTVSGEFRLPKEAEVILYLPLYNGLQALELGYETPLTAPGTLCRRKPIVFYGSSITQGGCASRPGNSYAAMVCRALGYPQHNLGFSGNGKGEIEMARYIASLPMTALVMDYDHNAPDAAHLQRTHLPFLQTILEAQPELPVLVLSRPDTDSDPDGCHQRRMVIRQSVTKLQQQGYHCHFLNGKNLFPDEWRQSCTVDGCHPNDLGFSFMAEKVKLCLQAMLGE